MKLKIRFVKKDQKYCLQIKRWGAWRYANYVQHCGIGSVSFLYSDKNKKCLLEKVLDREYKTCKKYVTIHEYPTVKIY